MRKEETLEVLKTISDYFPNFSYEQRTFDSWHRVLQHKEFDQIISNLTVYVEMNRFPPSLSDLLEVEPLRGRGVKTAAETLEMLKKYESKKPVEPIDPRTLPGWKELGEQLRKGVGR